MIYTPPNAQKGISKPVLRFNTVNTAILSKKQNKKSLSAPYDPGYGTMADILFFVHIFLLFFFCFIRVLMLIHEQQLQYILLP